MVLYEIIEFLEKYNPAKTVKLGFHNPHSYRGSYDELAFEPVKNTTVGEMLNCAKSSLNETFTGWKGGEYTMDNYTMCWIASEGHSDGERIGLAMLHLMMDDVDGLHQYKDIVF